VKKVVSMVLVALRDAWCLLCASRLSVRGFTSEKKASDKRDPVRWMQRGRYIKLNFMASDNLSTLRDAHLSYFVYNQITLSNLHYCLSVMHVSSRRCIGIWCDAVCSMQYSCAGFESVAVCFKDDTHQNSRGEGA
jgi:hypothetical protein